MLPFLREELILYPGPTTSKGAPGWLLHDPGRNIFFQIDWLTFEFLSRWHLNDPKTILTAIEHETTIQPEESDLIAVIRFLNDNELIQRHDSEGSSWYWQQAKTRHISWWYWLLHHYLFFRIPLWRPDDWLKRALPWVKVFYAKPFFISTLFALFIGLIEVSRQWDVFVAVLMDVFSWWGMIKYMITLVFVKLLHELGHALTAKRYDCRVPAIGVAFLVMFPMAYTDVNDIWKLSDRRQRLAVGVAGLLVELAMAAWATLAWTILPNGHLRDIAFLLATTTWISTLLINTSPFMRFDGYFLLMDWLEMPNLHSRVFSMACWWLRERIFGLGIEPPEFLPRGRYVGLLLFAFIIMLYRFIIFGSIAAMVYYWFPKPLGPLLAAIEIGWFILLPIWLELKSWRNLRSMILRSNRTWLTLGIIGLLLMAMIIPWDRRVQSQGLLRTAQNLLVVAPEQARITSLPVVSGEFVDRNGTLIVLDSPLLGYKQHAATMRTANLRWQAATAGVDSKLRAQNFVLKREINKAEAELVGIQDDQNRYRPFAPFSGNFYWVDPDLRVGDWVGKNNILGMLANTSRWVVETYLPETDLNRIHVGDMGWFYSKTPDVVHLKIRVDNINHDATRTLLDGILSSTRGGEVPAREIAHSIIPEMSLYRVTLAITENYAPVIPQVLSGQVVLFGTSKAFMKEFIQAAMGLFVREAGF